MIRSTDACVAYLNYIDHYQLNQKKVCHIALAVSFRQDTLEGNTLKTMIQCEKFQETSKGRHDQGFQQKGMESTLFAKFYA